MKVLVCGGRRFAIKPNKNDYPIHADFRRAEQRYALERNALVAYLTTWHSQKPISLLIHGDAPGADRAAGDWASDTGVQEVRCPANWRHFEKRAGFLRNGAMLLLQPDVVIAFPGGPGTADMMAQAMNKGIRVVPVAVPLYAG